MLVHMNVSFLYFSNNPLNPASVDDAMAFLMIIHYTCTGLFYGVIIIIVVLFLDLSPRKKYTPSLMRAYGSEG